MEKKEQDLITLFRLINKLELFDKISEFSTNYENALANYQNIRQERFDIFSKLENSVLTDEEKSQLGLRLRVIDIEIMDLECRKYSKLDMLQMLKQAYLG